MLMVSFFTPFSEGKERDQRHEMGQWYFIFPGALHISENSINFENFGKNLKIVPTFLNKNPITFCC